MICMQPMPPQLMSKIGSVDPFARALAAVIPATTTRAQVPLPAASHGASALRPSRCQIRVRRNVAWYSATLCSSTNLSRNTVWEEVTDCRNEGCSMPALPHQIRARLPSASHQTDVIASRGALDAKNADLSIGPTFDEHMLSHLDVDHELKDIKEEVGAFKAMHGEACWKASVAATQRPISSHHSAAEAGIWAFYKLVEIVRTPSIPAPRTSLHICEAPGGFAQAVAHEFGNADIYVTSRTNDGPAFAPA